MSFLSRMQSLLPRELTWVPGLSETIQLVGKSEYRMAKQHPWSGVAHNLPGLSPSGRLIAVNRAVGASWLVFSIWTFLQPHLSIILKYPTRCAQDVPGTVMVSGAIDADHLAHG